jgi:ABC-type hemin transport system substrate-binding protein
MTESLFELGMGDRIVGITDYCIHPLDATEGIPRIGGTKNPRVSNILALQPDLVLANQEENTREAVRKLESSGIPVWLMYPKTVREALDDLWEPAVSLEIRGCAAIRVLDSSLEW